VVVEAAVSGLAAAYSAGIVYIFLSVAFLLPYIAVLLLFFPFSIEILLSVFPPLESASLLFYRLLNLRPPRPLTMSRLSFSVSSAYFFSSASSFSFLPFILASPLLSIFNSFSPPSPS